MDRWFGRNICLKRWKTYRCEKAHQCPHSSLNALAVASLIVADHWLLTYLLMLVQYLMDRFLGTTQLSSFHREWKELTAAQTQLSVTCLLFLIHTFYFIARHASLIAKYYLLHQFSISYKGKFSLGLVSRPVA